MKSLDDLWVPVGDVFSDPYFTSGDCEGDDLDWEGLNMDTVDNLSKSAGWPQVSYPASIIQLREQYKSVIQRLHDRNAKRLESLTQQEASSSLPKTRLNLIERLRESDRQFEYLWTVIDNVLEQLLLPQTVEEFQQREWEFLRHAEEFRTVNNTLEQECSVLELVNGTRDILYLPVPDPARNFRDNEDSCCDNKDILEDYESHPWYRHRDTGIKMSQYVKNIMEGRGIHET